MKKKLFKIPIFTLNQRKGILALAFLVITIQIAYFLYLKYKKEPSFNLSKADKEWLAQQIILDSIQQIDSVATNTIYPFNPNFISDYKGYQLGMSIDEIDRLHQYRAQNKYVNSAGEFQKITQISDSLLASMQSYFKFPDWTQNKSSDKNIDYKKRSINQPIDKNNIILKEFNSASFSDLQLVNGIGEVLSQRIIDERNKYNGFVSWYQIELIYGLKPEVIRNLKKHFVLTDFSTINKININSAAIQDIAKVPFIKYTLAKDIVIYRSKYGDFKSVDDLFSVNNFPKNQADIINMYLIFE